MRNWPKKFNKAVFPGTQGGPLEHVIAAKAVCFGEALKPEFKAYQQRVVTNAARARGRTPEAGLRSGRRRHGQPPDAHRPAKDRRDRQGAAAPSGRGVHHRQQECHPERPGKSVRHLGHASSARPLSPPAASVRRRCSALPSSSGRPQPISTTRQTISAEMYAISAQIFQFTNNICRLPTVGVGFFVGFVRFA